MSGSPRPCGVIIVAHPDDDAIFAGPYQLASRWIDWQVVCVTHQAGDERGRELVDWQARAGGTVHFLGMADDPADLKRKVSGFSEDEVRLRLEALDFDPELVLTHDPGGEYGHPHHVTVSRAVLGMYPGVPKITFAHYLKTPDFKIEVPDFAKQAMEAYPSQRKVIRHFHRKLKCCRIGRYRLADEGAAGSSRGEGGALL